jgi:CPA2 family monovalent cation:H+ antiporter-2
MGVRVLSLRRAQGQTVVLAEDSTLEGGDTLVLSGRPAGLALAEEKLLK